MSTAADIDVPAHSTTAVTARTGAIVLARHGEPSLSRRVKLDAEGYRRWWARYEEGGLLGGQTAPPALVEAARAAGAVYTSIRTRSLETARAVCPQRKTTADAVFIEAPLPPPRFPSWVRLTPRQWGVISRFWWWWFNHHNGEESRRQAEARASTAADRLLTHTARGEDVVLLAHGFFNAMIGVELRRRGWRCTSEGGYGYWSLRRFEEQIGK